MDAEEIGRRIHDVLEPRLRRLREEAEAGDAFNVVNCGITEYGPYICTGGLCLEPLRFPVTQVTFSFGFIVIRHPDAGAPLISAGVAWHRGSGPGETGFAIHEANAGPIQFTGPDSIDRLVRHFGRLEAAMRAGMRRGRPPSRLLTFARRALGRCRAPQHFSLPA